MSRRMERVNSTLRTEISKVLTSKVRDPRLYSLISITKVDTSPDMQTCKVSVSVLGGDADKRKAFKALNSAAGYIQRQVRDGVYMRSVPRLSFHLDDSIERANELFQTIAEANSGSGTETP